MSKATCGLKVELRSKKNEAIIVLPSGNGTFEGVIGVLTLNQLGHFFKPILLFNQEGFSYPLIKMMGD